MRIFFLNLELKCNKMEDEITKIEDLIQDQRLVLHVVREHTHHVQDQDLLILVRDLTHDQNEITKNV